MEVICNADLCVNHREDDECILDRIVLDDCGGCFCYESVEELDLQSEEEADDKNEDA